MQTLYVQIEPLGRLQFQACWDERDFDVRASVPVPRWLARATDRERGRALVTC